MDEKSSEVDDIDLSNNSAEKLIFRYTGFGYYLKAEIVKKHGLSASRLASILNISEKLMGLILSNKIKIDLDMAGQLAKHFDTDSRYWLHLQDQINQPKIM